MLRKSLMALLLGLTLAGAVTSYAQEPPKPEGPEVPIPKPDPDLRA